MANFQPHLTPSLREFIARQQVFFTATAPLSPSARINLSPKGCDTFRVLSESEVAYLDLTGSGNETAAHVRENGRITIMFCSFDEMPLILRLYGRGTVVRPASPQWNDLINKFSSMPGQRQIIHVAIESVQSSCGFGVPVYEFRGQRNALLEWAQKKGEERLNQYRLKCNLASIDGLPTGLCDERQGG